MTDETSARPSKTMDLEFALKIADSHAQIDDVLEYVALRVLASAVRAAQIHTADRCSSDETCEQLKCVWVRRHDGSSMFRMGCTGNEIQHDRAWKFCPSCAKEIARAALKANEIRGSDPHDGKTLCPPESRCSECWPENANEHVHDWVYADLKHESCYCGAVRVRKNGEGGQP
jgi:hypothetical protein